MVLTEDDKSCLRRAAELMVNEPDEHVLIDLLPGKLEMEFWAFFSGKDGFKIRDILNPDWPEIKVMMLLMFAEAAE